MQKQETVIQVHTLKNSFTSRKFIMVRDIFRSSYELPSAFEFWVLYLWINNQMFKQMHTHKNTHFLKQNTNFPHLKILYLKYYSNSH
jgi:hypothetical protein